MSRAVVLENGQVQVNFRTVPAPRADEVLIRLRLAGICSTDEALLGGYADYQGVLGHEFVGEVIEGPAEWLRQRVVGEINIADGSCDMCQMGLPSHCRQRSVLGIRGNYDGAFADAFRLPVRNLHRVPERLSDEEAVFAEPLAAAAQILELVHIKPTDRVIILGTGKLGMLVAQVLHVMGVSAIGIVRHAHHAALLHKWGIQSRTRDQVGDNEAAVVVDCTGTAAGFTESLQLLRPRGTLILKSTYSGSLQADLSQAVVNEITVVGSRCGPFPVALEHLLRGRIDVKSMIEAEYNLDSAVEALEYASQRGVLKVLLRP